MLLLVAGILQEPVLQQRPVRCKSAAAVTKLACLQVLQQHTGTAQALHSQHAPNQWQYRLALVLCCFSKLCMNRQC